MKNVKMDYVPRWAMSLSDDKWLNKLSSKVKTVHIHPLMCRLSFGPCVHDPVEPVLVAVLLQSVLKPCQALGSKSKSYNAIIRPATLFIRHVLCLYSVKPLRLWLCCWLKH